MELDVAALRVVERLVLRPHAATLRVVDKGSGAELVLKTSWAPAAGAAAAAEAELFACADAYSPHLLPCAGAVRNPAGPGLALVYRYLPGGSLDAAASSAASALAAASAVGSALAALHAAQESGWWSEPIVHGDVKPANVLVDADGTMILADYGVSSPVRAARADAGADVAGFAGSPAYASPHATAGYPPSPADDMWSLGVVLYQLALGCLPDFDVATGALLRGLPDFCAAPGASQADAETLRALVAGLLTLDPAERLTAAETLALLGINPPPAAPPQAAPSPTQPAPAAPAPAAPSRAAPPPAVLPSSTRERPRGRIKVAGRSSSSLSAEELAMITKVPR
ncbi:serine/threonine protein kinase [Thecamonas trahens ATCC 50062]|uniref:non-specific serine/threonine protein kinase n=1 Tax=Thecamonas trahens ATCC 50062 TaxID=461836 RepID=A0A0L0D9X1_THETB|nr:serine/threonine protein kinase [Thecamonas trahens ATCC 50062]KNC48891.1 serine/threonine protein kinase [Thecamonas trahens ATCC 50062]|eukprot:XP_013758309.1 serine/threonine protein kinase [Thecamonas trahens ATCC 50062]